MWSWYEVSNLAIPFLSGKATPPERYQESLVCVLRVQLIDQALLVPLNPRRS